jgi:hypothetical protein
LTPLAEEFSLNEWHRVVDVDIFDMVMLYYFE